MTLSISLIRNKQELQVWDQLWNFLGSRAVGPVVRRVRAPVLHQVSDLVSNQAEFYITNQMESESQ